MFTYARTCNSFDYRKFVTDVKLHCIERERKKTKRWFSTIWYAADDTVCIGTGIVCNLADKRPIWVENGRQWKKAPTKFVLVCITQLSVRTFAMVWAHQACYFFVFFVQLFIMSVQCAYTFHLMVCCRYNTVADLSLMLFPNGTAYATIYTQENTNFLLMIRL